MPDPFFNVVYFSRGSLPKKRGEKATTGGPTYLLQVGLKGRQKEHHQWGHNYEASIPFGDRMSCREARTPSPSPKPEVCPQSALLSL